MLMLPMQALLRQRWGGDGLISDRGSCWRWRWGPGSRGAPSRADRRGLGKSS
jgi:hypothetical protein